MNTNHTVLVGLNQHHRITWQDPHNRICYILATLGFSNNTIARHTGLTPSQISYRCHKKDVRLSDYRKGKGTRAAVLLDKYGLRKKQMTG